MLAILVLPQIPIMLLGWNGNDVGVKIGSGIGNLALGRSGGTKNGNHILVMKRLADGSDGTWDAIRLGNFDRSVDTSIKLEWLYIPFY